MTTKLTVPTHKLFGRFLLNDKNRAAVVLSPEEGDENTVYLRYALTEMGTLRPLWPAFVLDDWGKERKGLAMFRWIRQEGDRFPRAEVFGYDDGWQEVQAFLRALELYVRYPCKVYPTAETPPQDGYWVKHIILPDETAVQPMSFKELPTNLPAGFNAPQIPLAQAKVTWWLVHPQQIETFEF